MGVGATENPSAARRASTASRVVFSRFTRRSSGALASKTVTKISAGYEFTCALDTDHKAYCWGAGSFGQLGNGANAISNVPVAVDMSGVAPGNAFTQISAGEKQACGLTSAGTVYCYVIEWEEDAS